MSEKLNRRRFISRMAVTSAGLSVVGAGQVKGTVANSKIEVGCIGLGGRGTMIANMFGAHGGYQVKALCDYFPEVVQAKAKQMKVAKERCFSGLQGYQRMIESGVDAVVLETPPWCFPEHAAAAVDAGCHVYVAKPVAIDAPGTLHIGKLGRQATQEKLVFHVDFQMRVNPYLIECIRLLKEGIIGDVHFIRSFYDDDGYRDPPMGKTLASRFRGLVWCNDIALGGGKFVNSGVHAIDAALWIAGKVPVSASGSSIIARREPHGDSADIYSITYRFKDNDLILTHTGEHYRNLNSRIAHCDAFGEYGYLEARYSDKNWIRSERKDFSGGYKGGSRGDLYRWGAQQNIDMFHKSIVNENYDNPTVEPSVNANLTCILGQHAADNHTELTWDEMIKANKKIEPDLTGLVQ